jgi:small GTP-binding protein
MAADLDDEDIPAMKVVFLGSTLVGKTSLVTQATSSQFDWSIKPTIGASYASKIVKIGPTLIKLQIWDTAGQERFKTLVPMYFRGAAVAVIVFSLIDPPSLHDVDFWASAVKQSASPPPAIFVAGNKVDLDEERTLTAAQGEAVARQYGAEYWEISAKSGEHVEEMMNRIAEVGVARIKNEPAAKNDLVVKIMARNDKGKKKCC